MHLTCSATLILDVGRKDDKRASTRHVGQRGNEDEGRGKWDVGHKMTKDGRVLRTARDEERGTWDGTRGLGTEGRGTRRDNKREKTYVTCFYCS